MGKPVLKGIIPATVLPMDSRYRIDEEALRVYIGWLLRFDIGGLAVNVDTGEGPHLYHEERVRVLEVVSEVVKGKVPIIAGLPASFTDQAIKMARDYLDAGADALLVFPIPSFRGAKPAEVAYRYHKALASEADAPIVLFQLQPDLGGIIYDEETIRRLLSIDNVVAIKEASFNARIFIDTRRIVREERDDIAFLTGNDNFILESFILGADGALIGFGTLATGLQIEMYKMVKARRYGKAFKIYEQIRSLAEAVFAQPVRNYRARTKEALVMLGVLKNAYVRPPLLPIGEREKARLRAALKRAGLL